MFYEILSSGIENYWKHPEGAEALGIFEIGHIRPQQPHLVPKDNIQTSCNLTEKSYSTTTPLPDKSPKI